MDARFIQACLRNMRNMIDRVDCARSALRLGWQAELRFRAVSVASTFSRSSKIDGSWQSLLGFAWIDLANETTPLYYRPFSVPSSMLSRLRLILSSKGGNFLFSSLVPPNVAPVPVS